MWESAEKSRVVGVVGNGSYLENFSFGIYFICYENVSTNVLFSSYNFLDIFIIVSRFSGLGEYFNSHFNKFYPFSFVFWSSKLEENNKI